MGNHIRPRDTRTSCTDHFPTTAEELRKLRENAAPITVTHLAGYAGSHLYQLKPDDVAVFEGDPPIQITALKVTEERLSLKCAVGTAEYDLLLHPETTYTIQRSRESPTLAFVGIDSPWAKIRIDVPQSS